MPHTAEHHLPLRPVDLQILLVLAEGQLHGYGLMKAVHEESAGRVSLEVGSLYRVINRLMDGELIDRVEASATNADARRKHDYVITDLGREVVKLEAARLAEVLATARARDLAGSS